MMMMPPGTPRSYATRYLILNSFLAECGQSTHRRFTRALSRYFVIRAPQPGGDPFPGLSASGVFGECIE
jgi:hypothetical protein